jgi:Fe-S oxidoreductase
MASYDCIKDIILESNKEAIFLKGFDKAIIGTGRIVGKPNIIAAYDADNCIKILIEEHDMDEIEAFEHFKACLEQVKINDNNPLFINDFRQTINTETEKPGDFQL